MARAVVAVLCGTASMMASHQAIAQASLQRVEVTGSAIKRVDAETALPVIVIQRQDIERSGATSVVDLMQKLPAIQGSVHEAASVGGETFGFSGVSVHNLGEQRTLVLLNGHRMALFGGQTLTGFAAGFDLNALPVAAIERVEVLTDGASALYGSDAIAGVVNFITKRNTTDGDVTVGYSAPQGGAQEKRFSLTKGFGESDKWNIFLAYAHDERTKLNSTQRDFASTGRVFFSQNGRNFRIQQYSPSPIPANVYWEPSATSYEFFNPYLRENGNCAERNFEVNDGDIYCGFDFVGELEIYPVRKRDAAFASATFNLGNHQLYSDLLWSKTQQTSRIAPVPGQILLAAGTALHTQYLLPHGVTDDAIAYYRFYDLGKRESNDEAKFLDFVAGSRGTFGRFDYDAFYTHSESKAASRLSGYPGALAVRRLANSGLLNPFVLPGQQTAAAQAAINAVNYTGYWNGGTSRLDTFNLRGSTELMRLPAGPMALAAGINYNREKFQSAPSLFAQGLLSDPVAGTLCDPSATSGPTVCDTRFGDAAATVPYSADRKNWGVYGELAVPVAKDLELTLSARHDDYSDFGTANTGKAAARWKISPNLLVRGSLGTGFRAPTVPQVAASAQPYGVTSGNYNCATRQDIAAVATSLGVQCRAGNVQFDVIAGGNPNLSPEKSTQGTLGFRVEPAQWLSAGADFWWVRVKDVFGTLPENTVFADPAAHPEVWTSYFDISTGQTYLAWFAGNQNLGNQYSSGIDFDISSRHTTGLGRLDMRLNATYMLREKAQQIPNGPYYSSIADYNNNVGGPTFRWLGRATASMKTGAFTNTLVMNFRSGYMDQETSVEELDAGGNVIGFEDVRVKIKPYYSFDWQTRYDFNKRFSFTVGVLNLFDRKPPFAISSGGTNRGQMFGYDDRYYDPRGRTWYVNATMNF